MTPTLHPHLAALEQVVIAFSYQPHVRCVGTWARDASGAPCCPSSRAARTWCVLGLVAKELGLTKAELEAELASSAFRAPCLASFWMAVRALFSEYEGLAYDGVVDVKISRWMDTLAPKDVVTFVQMAHDRERLRLGPKP